MFQIPRLLQRSQPLKKQFDAIIYIEIILHILLWFWGQWKKWARSQFLCSSDIGCIQDGVKDGGHTIRIFVSWSFGDNPDRAYISCLGASNRRFIKRSAPMSRPASLDRSNESKLVSKMAGSLLEQIDKISKKKKKKKKKKMVHIYRRKKIFLAHIMKKGYKQCLLDTPDHSTQGSFYNVMTLKMRSRSTKSNLFFPLS